MTQQGNFKDGRPGRVGRHRPRGGKPRHPAARSRAGRGAGRNPRHQDRHAGLAGGERQSARDGEIEHRRLAPGLDDDGAQGGTPRSFDAGAENAGRVAGAHKDQSRRIETKREEAWRMKPSGLPIRIILSRPEKAAAARSLDRQSQSKRRRGGGLHGRAGENLMQCALRETAAQRRVERGGSQAEKLGRTRFAEPCRTWRPRSQDKRRSS